MEKLKSYLKKLRNRKGFMSLIIVMFLSVILPIFLFFLVDENYLYGMKDQFQSYNDRTAAAGAMQVDPILQKDGVVQLDAEQVSNYVDKSLILNFHLNDDMSVTDESQITDPPVVKTYVVNNPGDFTTDEGFEYNITQPTVIVYTEVKPKQLFVSKLITFRSISAYQVGFKPGTTSTIMSNKKMSSDGLVVTLNNVASPMNDSGTTLFPLDWQFSPVPMSAGGNIDFSIYSENSSTDPDEAEYDLILDNGAEYQKTIHRTMTKETAMELNDNVTLPTDAPIGTKVIVKFTSITGGTLDMMNPAGDQFGIIQSNVGQLLRIQKAYHKKQ